MSGSSFGNHFKVTTWGESHGKGLGVIIDGCPAGLALCEKDIQPYLERRRPGQSRYTTKRSESDQVEILSGVFEGKTTGTPISLTVWNNDQHSADYSEIARYYRPGHADYNFDRKYGFRDYRGGGRSSGRETVGRVAAGAIACRLLDTLGITFSTYTLSIGPVCIDRNAFDASAVTRNPFCMPDMNAADKAAAWLEECMKNENSSGGVIECVIHGMPAGIGEPVFDKLDANLAKAVFSIGAVKGFEIGDGFLTARATGLTNNDGYLAGADGKTVKATNHSGGITGGMSDGCDIVFRAAIKPTPSIAAGQQSVTQDGENISIRIRGRHDPVIVPRAVVVVEAMAALTITDMLFAGMTSRLDDVRSFFRSRN